MCLIEDLFSECDRERGGRHCVCVESGESHFVVDGRKRRVREVEVGSCEMRGFVR